MLSTADTLVLVCVNHDGSRQADRIQLFAPPIPVVAVFDLVTMQPYPFRQTAEALEIEVDLGEREGLLLGLYPAVPAQSAIQVDHARVRAGESLAFTVELIDSMGQPGPGRPDWWKSG